MPEATDAAPSVTTRRAKFLIATILVVGVFLRAAEAAKSFWLDEFHTLDVASAPTVRGVIERLAPDFHAPAYFVAVHSLPLSLDESLRWLSIVANLAMFVPLLFIAREGRCGAAGYIPMAAALACLPFQIQYGAELRPYSWLMLSSATMAAAAFTSVGSARFRFWLFVAAASFGLWTHYLAAVAVLAIGATSLFLPRDARLLGFKAVFLGGTLAVLSFLPWVLWDESWILTDPGVMFRNEAADRPENGEVAPIHEKIPLERHLPELMSIGPRLAAPMVSSLGKYCAGSMMLGLVALACLSVLGAANSARRSNRHLARGLDRSLVASFLMVVMVTILDLKVWERFPIQYFAVAAWGIPLIAARLGGSFAVARRPTALAAVTIGTLLTMGMSHVIGAPREDLRRAVDVADRMSAQERAVATAILRQPPHYRHEMPLIVYGRDPTKVFSPVDVDQTEVAGRLSSVVVVTRSIDPAKLDAGDPLWRKIMHRRRLERVERIDAAIDVLMFVDERETTGK